jgi:hypothetical protein
MLSQAGERTLTAGVIPPATGHIDGCFSLTFKSIPALLAASAVSASVVADFLAKSTGKANFRDEIARQLPDLTGSALYLRLAVRVVLLNCLTIHYADLWSSAWDPHFATDTWATKDPRLAERSFSALTPEWSWSTPLRSDFERRQALMEIDVLVAQALGLTLDELLTIYRIQFPVLQQNERDTWYDQNGRIVFTANRGLPGVGVDRSQWDEIRDMKSGTVSRTVVDDTLPGGPRERTITYAAPFDRCDRETDYVEAWRAFSGRLGPRARGHDGEA